MKIHDVRVHPIHTEIPVHKRVESGAGLKLARQMCLIEVESTDGVVGYGSPSGPYDLGVLTAVIEGAIKPHLLSANPGDIEHHWDRLYFGEISRNSGNRSVGMAALSGIDIALWDLKGKALGVPLYDLLGGQFYPDGVRAYASSIYWDTTPEAAAEEARVLVDQGFRGVKLKVGRSFEQDLANIATIRRSLDPEIELLIDANQSLDRIGANRLLEVAEEHDCYWFEEPLSIDDVEGHRQLRERRRSVRIATGENLYGRWAFTDYVRREAIDVLQADVSRAGGITEVRKIADLALCHHLTWNPHTFNDLITVAANLHLVTASPQAAMFEWDITHNSLMDDLADWTLEMYDGVIRAPGGPGLGLEIDLEFVKAHRWDGQPSIGAGHAGRG